MLVKIFKCDDLDMLERKINDFIRENEVKKFYMTSPVVLKKEYVIAISYEEKASIGYGGYDSDAPDCPSCGSKMVKRSRRSDGKQFWGCSRYSEGCRGLVNIEEDVMPMASSGFRENGNYNEYDDDIPF